MSEPDEPDAPEERPELATQEPVNAADKKQQRRRKRAQQFQDEQQAAFLKRVLADPEGRKFLWDILMDAHAFEVRYGFGPNGMPHSEATWRYAGEQDFGLRLYLKWSNLDRAGILSLHDEFDPRFKKGK